MRRQERRNRICQHWMLLDQVRQARVVRVEVCVTRGSRTTCSRQPRGRTDTRQPTASGSEAQRELRNGASNAVDCVVWYLEVVSSDGIVNRLRETANTFASGPPCLSIGARYC